MRTPPLPRSVATSLSGSLGGKYTLFFVQPIAPLPSNVATTSTRRTMPTRAMCSFPTDLNSFRFIEEHQPLGEQPLRPELVRVAGLEVELHRLHRPAGGRLAGGV